MAHPPRMAGFGYRGRIRVFITANTYFRQPLLAEEAVAEFVSWQLLRTARSHNVEVTAYCILRNHIHVLLSGLSTEAHIPALVARWKQQTGYWYKYRRPPASHPGRVAQRLWQSHYADRVVRNEAQTLELLRYIATDPLRSGLVGRLEDYAWFGSDCWSREDLIEIAGTRGAPYWWPGGE